MTTVPREYLNHRIVEAAREWLEDRVPHSRVEKQLVVTLYDAFPGDFDTKENCSCDLKPDCDECLSAAELRAAIDKMRDECREPYRDAPIAAARSAGPGRPE